MSTDRSCGYLKVKHDSPLAEFIQIFDEVNLSNVHFFRREMGLIGVFYWDLRCFYIEQH